MAFRRTRSCLVISVVWKPSDGFQRLLARLKLFEYLGAGLPTIGPDTPAVREVFKDGVHLRLVKQDGSNLANAILELKNNPPFRKELAIKGQKLVLNEYSWKKCRENHAASSIFKECED